MRRIRFALVSFSTRLHLTRSMAVTTTAYGWMVESVPGTLARRWRVAIRDLLGISHISSPYLYMLLLGHTIDLRFQAGLTLLRFVRLHCLMLGELIAFPPALAQWLRSLSFYPEAPQSRVWTYQGTLPHQYSLNFLVCEWPKVEHVLRDSWRCNMFQSSWFQSDRRDAIAARDTEVSYSPVRVKLASQMSASSRAALSVLTGGYVNPKQFSVMTQRELPHMSAVIAACPCGREGVLSHAMWECEIYGANLSTIGLAAPSMLDDFLLWRLAWPRASPRALATGQCVPCTDDILRFQHITAQRHRLLADRWHLFCQHAVRLSQSLWSNVSD